MAKIHTEVLVIKFSKLVKDTEKNIPTALSEELIAAVEQVAQELAPNGVVAEVEVRE